MLHADLAAQMQSRYTWVEANFCAVEVGVGRKKEKLLRIDLEVGWSNAETESRDCALARRVGILYVCFKAVPGAKVEKL